MDGYLYYLMFGERWKVNYLDEGDIVFIGCKIKVLVMINIVQIIRGLVFKKVFFSLFVLVEN